MGPVGAEPEFSALQRRAARDHLLLTAPRQWPTPPNLLVLCGFPPRLSPRPPPALTLRVSAGEDKRQPTRPLGAETPPLPRIPIGDRHPKEGLLLLRGIHHVLL